MKQRVKELLKENHPNEIGRLIGTSDSEAKKIVREIYLNDWGYTSLEDWEIGFVEEQGYVLFLKQGDEWIDEGGDFRCFDSEEQALDHLRDSLSLWHEKSIINACVLGFQLKLKGAK
jgi:hypothetical protein